MTTMRALATMRTVPPSQSRVNTLFPVTTRGERLRSYLLAVTGGAPGWQAKLVTDSGVKRQTISKWTNPKFDGYPDMAALAQVAGALNVRPFQLVAILDGDGQVVRVEDQLTRDNLREEIEAALTERLGPRRATRGQAGAA